MTIPASTSAPTPLAQLEPIQLNRLSINQDSVSLDSDQLLKASELWKDSPVLIQVVRRPGCINCREIAYELNQHRSLIDQLGIRVVAVFKENLPEDVLGFYEYAKCDMFVDKDLGFFKALTGGKLVKHNPLLTLLRPFIWKGIKRASQKGVKNGSLGGEASINGGFYLVSKAGVHYQNNEELGVLPPISELLTACKSISSDQSAVKLADTVLSEKSSELQKTRMVCTVDACTLKT